MWLIKISILYIKLIAKNINVNNKYLHFAKYMIHSAKARKHTNEKNKANNNNGEKNLLLVFNINIDFVQKRLSFCLLLLL